MSNMDIFSRLIATQMKTACCWMPTGRPNLPPPYDDDIIFLPPAKGSQS
jgi:hypothetical protein